MIAQHVLKASSLRTQAPPPAMTNVRVATMSLLMQQTPTALESPVAAHIATLALQVASIRNLAEDFVRPVCLERPLGLALPHAPNARKARMQIHWLAAIANHASLVSLQSRLAVLHAAFALPVASPSTRGLCHAPCADLERWLKTVVQELAFLATWAPSPTQSGPCVCRVSLAVTFKTMCVFPANVAGPVCKLASPVDHAKLEL